MAFRHVIADDGGKLRLNLGKSIVTPSTNIAVPSPSILRKGLGQSSIVETIQNIETPKTSLIRKGLDKVYAASSTDIYSANVSLLTYCNKNAKTNNSTFTDETGKTITVKSGGTPPAQCYLAYKSGNAFSPGQGANGSSLSNYFELAANQSGFWFGSGDWTMEFLVSSANWYTGASYFGTIFWIQRNLLDQYGIQFDYYNGSIRLSGNGANGLLFSWTPSNNIIYYVAIHRDGNNIRCTVNGDQIGSTSSWSGVTLNNVTSPNRFGGDSFNSHGECSFHGIRITKGVARDIFNPDALPWIYP